METWEIAQRHHARALVTEEHPNLDDDDAEDREFCDGTELFN